MEFDEMPTKCYKEIIKEMREIFVIWNKKFLKISEELVNLKKIKQESKNQGAVNIEDKVDKLIYDVKFQRQILYGERRVFYNRLEALDLIENDL
jgi:flagellar motor component MotA